MYTLNDLPEFEINEMDNAALQAAQEDAIAAGEFEGVEETAPATEIPVKADEPAPVVIEEKPAVVKETVKRTPTGTPLSPLGTVNGRTGKSQLAGNLKETLGAEGFYELFDIGDEKYRMVASNSIPESSPAVGKVETFYGAKNGRILFEGTLTFAGAGDEALKVIADTYGASMRSYMR